MRFCLRLCPDQTDPLRPSSSARERFLNGRRRIARGRADLKGNTYKGLQVYGRRWANPCTQSEGKCCCKPLSVSEKSALIRLYEGNRFVPVFLRHLLIKWYPHRRSPEKIFGLRFFSHAPKPLGRGNRRQTRGGKRGGRYRRQSASMSAAVSGQSWQSMCAARTALSESLTASSRSRSCASSRTLGSSAASRARSTKA